MTSEVFEPASFGSRLVARLIDSLILAVIGIGPVVAILAATLKGHPNPFSAHGNLLLTLLIIELSPLVAMLIYRIGSDGGSGQSVGRAAVGIRLVRKGTDMDASPIRLGYGLASRRLIVGVVGDALLGVGSLSMLWHPERRTWSDVSTGTAVIRDGALRGRAVRVLAVTVASMAVLAAVGAYAGVREHRLIVREQVTATQQPGSLPSAVPSTAPASTKPPTSPSPSAAPTTVPPATPVVINSDGSLLGAAVASMLSNYFSGINSRQYADAWVLLDSNEQNSAGTFANFANQLSTSSNSSIELHQTVDNGDGTYSASVTFQSTQAGSKGVNPGETCTDWSLVYKLVSDGSGGYLIDGVTSNTHSAC